VKNLTIAVPKHMIIEKTRIDALECLDVDENRQQVIGEW